MSVSIPQGEVFISRCDRVGREIIARFLNDYHPEVMGESSVLCLRVRDHENIDAIAKFLIDCYNVQHSVYLGQTADGLLIESEGGARIDIRQECIELARDEFDKIELNEALKRISKQYQSENLALRKAISRINSIRSLATEQVRRIQIKATPHGAGTTAATLYGQQLRFVDRILAQLDSDEDC